MKDLKEGCTVLYKFDNSEYEFSSYEENEYSSVKADLFPYYGSNVINKKVIYVRPLGSKEEFEARSASEFIVK